jgi:hypothetical protein
VVFAVGPDVLHWVQFRRVGRQVLRFQTSFLVTNELLCDPTAVCRKAVPNQQNVAIDVAEQVLEELNDLLGLDGLFEDLKVEVPEGDAGDYRQGLPVAVELENRRLPSRRPRAPPMRPLAQAAFVYEDDRPALFLGFFLISGQRFCCQSAIKASFRSNARPTGCCTLHLNCRRMRQTCPG